MNTGRSLKMEKIESMQCDLWREGCKSRKEEDLVTNGQTEIGGLKSHICQVIFQIQVKSNSCVLSLSLYASICCVEHFVVLWFKADHEVRISRMSDQFLESYDLLACVLIWPYVDYFEQMRSLCLHDCLFKCSNVASLQLRRLTQELTF